jgi:hypothetical protein
MRHKEVDESICIGERRIKELEMRIVMTSVRKVPPAHSITLLLQNAAAKE